MSDREQDFATTLLALMRAHAAPYIEQLRIADDKIKELETQLARLQEGGTK